MKRQILYALAAMGLLLFLAGCAGQHTVETPTTAIPAAESPTPKPTLSPTPTPIPTLSPMERKYSDFDPGATQLEPIFLDVSYTAVSKDSVEHELMERLYGTYYWEDDDTQLVIDELTLDGREYCVHAMQRYSEYDGSSVLFTYADEPGQYYRLNKYMFGSDPGYYIVEVSPIDDASDFGERVANEYSRSELEALFEEYEALYGEEDFYDDTETGSAVADGTVAYFRFMYDVGRYVAQNGQYVLDGKWTWSENQNTPPQPAIFSICLPQTISANGCPYTPCSSDVLDMTLGDAMFSSYDNLLNF